MALSELNIIAKLSEDLCPAEVLTWHRSEPVHDTSIHFRLRRYPPLLNGVVEEVKKMQAGGITTPVTSAWSFAVVVVTTIRVDHECLLTIVH